MKPHHHIRVRLTREGVITLVLFFFVILIAWNTGLYLYYAVVGGIFSLFVQSYFSGYMTLRRLDVSTFVPSGVYKQIPFPIQVRVRNRRKRLPIFCVEIIPVVSKAKAHVVPVLPPQTEATIRFTVTLERRGVYRVPDIELTTSGPFGFLKVSRRFDFDQEILVYPRVRPLQTVAFNEIQRLGNTPRRVVGDGGDFYSLREYQPGDDLRFVAWRASARANTLLVRELSAETSRETVVVLDTRRSGISDFDNYLEEAIDLAASLACTLLNRQFSVGLYALPDVKISLGVGSSQATKILGALARLEASSLDAPDPFRIVLANDWAPGVRFLFISADPSRWAQEVTRGFRVLNPREVIYA